MTSPDTHNRAYRFANSVKRTVKYWQFRLLRLNDEPDRIARGVFAGTFISFSPIFGFHYLLAPALAFAIRGNLIASLIFANVSNFLTFPFIATASIATGKLFLGSRHDDEIALEESLEDLSPSFGLTWDRLKDDNGEWDWGFLADVAEDLLVRYLLGGGFLGLVFGLSLAWLVYWIVPRFRMLRARKRAARREQP